MLGYKVGDTFEWDTPGGTRNIRIKDILYQPEASGDEQWTGESSPRAQSFPRRNLKFVEPQIYTEALLSVEMDKSSFGYLSVL